MARYPGEQDAGVLQPVIATLHRGVGLQSLERISVSGFALGDVGFTEFLAALEGSGRAQQIVMLSFWGCNIGVERARALADLLSRGVLPALKSICLAWNTLLGDQGVVALLGAVQEVPHRSLSELDLSNVGMCDGGMATLASAVQDGCMGRLMSLKLHSNPGVSDEGIIALAQAIESVRDRCGDSAGGDVPGLWRDHTCFSERLSTARIDSLAM